MLDTLKQVQVRKPLIIIRIVEVERQLQQHIPLHHNRINQLLAIGIVVHGAHGVVEVEHVQPFLGYLHAVFVREEGAELELFQAY